MIRELIKSTLLSIVFCSNLFAAQESMRCNGYAELCDRRYDEIAQINSHNATSYAASPVQNQDRTIAQQFNDGIRVFKMPIHLDYKRSADYYADLIESYITQLNNKINKAKLTIINNQKSLAHTLQEKQRDVDSLQHNIDDAERRIQDLHTWYNKLEDFSFSDPSSKTTRSIDYAARVSAFTIEKKSLQAAKLIATKTLNATKSALIAILEQDPRLINLKAQKFLAEKALRAINKKGTHEIFACHTLAKRELYQNYIDALIKQAPESIRPVVNVFLTPFSLLEKKGVVLLFGTQSQGGGIAPYPVCFLDRSATPFKDFLQQIKGFLDKHPHEVITILLNDFVEEPERLARAFEEAGLMSSVYAQDRNAPWPTLRELIEQGRRLIVFTDTEYDQKKYPWLNYRNFYNAWKGSYNFTSTNIFTNPKTPIERFGTFGPLDEIDPPSGPRNKLLDIHHVVTPGLAGDRDASKIVNKRSVFRAHMKRIANAAQHIPNFISIDFYEYPSVAHPKGDVFDVIEELNGVGKYAGKPLWKPKE